MTMQQALCGLARHPVGEVLLTNSSGNWSVPAGVRRVSLVLIGRGGKAVKGESWQGSNAGGGGGALTYANNIVVTPGQLLAYTTGTAGNSTHTTILGLIATRGGNASAYNNAGSGGAASTSGGATASFAGGNGKMDSSAYNATGGGGGRYNAAGSGSLGVDVYGEGGGVDGPYGRGAGAEQNPTPQPGAIRIIWGTGRSFPNNAT